MGTTATDIAGLGPLSPCPKEPLGDKRRLTEYFFAVDCFKAMDQGEATTGETEDIISWGLQSEESSKRILPESKTSLICLPVPESLKIFYNNISQI